MQFSKITIRSSEILVVAELATAFANKADLILSVLRESWADVSMTVANFSFWGKLLTTVFSSLLSLSSTKRCQSYSLCLKIPVRISLTANMMIDTPGMVDAIPFMEPTNPSSILLAIPLFMLTY